MKNYFRLKRTIPHNAIGIMWDIYCSYAEIGNSVYVLND